MLSVCGLWSLLHPWCSSREQGCLRGTYWGLWWNPSFFSITYIARGKLLWVWLRASVIFTATLLPRMLYVKRISVEIGWGLGELTALPTGRWDACHQLQWVSHLEGRDGCTRGIFMFLACLWAVKSGYLAPWVEWHECLMEVRWRVALGQGIWRSVFWKAPF